MVIYLIKRDAVLTDYFADLLFMKC